MADEVFFFNFSYLHPQELSSLLSIDMNEALNRSKAAIAREYERTWVGQSERWDGTSVPTLRSKKEADTKGYFTRLSAAEYQTVKEYFKVGDEWEVTVHPADGEPPVDCKTLLLNEETFTYPCYPLIEAVAKTDAAYYYLSKDETTVGKQDYIEMPIINGATSAEEG